MPIRVLNYKIIWHTNTSCPVMTSRKMIKLPTLESIPQNSNKFSLYCKESAILDELNWSEMTTRFVGLVIAQRLNQPCPRKSD